MKRHSLQLGRFALTSVAFAALLVHAPAWSLGLGRLSVQSALGETLKAEIDVTSVSAEEASSLKIRVAPPEAYRSAGVDYNAVLPGTQISLQRRGDRQVLVLSSDRSVQEPFVDVILELNWATGRLVREYTLLFDPPSVAKSPLPASVTTPSALTAIPLPPSLAPSRPSASPAPSNPTAASAEPTAPASAPRPSRPSAARPSVAATPAPEKGLGDTEYRVKPGDTLSRIAGQNLSPGVSLDQMLVALHRSNGAAFIDNNMNRLKAGVVLNVPSAETAGGIPATQARQVIQAQSADFRAYAQRLASEAPRAQTESSGAKAGGRIKATVDDKKSGPTLDSKLTLSNGGANAQAAASTPEAKISRERQRKETNDRMNELATNVQRLKEVQASASNVVAPAGAPAVAPPAPAPALAPAVTPPPPLPPVPVPPPPPPAPVEPPAAPASAPEPVPAPAPASEASPMVPSVETPGTLPASPEAASAPAPSASADVPFGTMSSIFGDNSLALVIGGGLIALVAGLGIYRLSRRSRKDSGETSFLESRPQPDSFFGASGGQRVDTRNEAGASSLMSYSLSQLDAIGDVDPVAEADVYLAYGRDLQAEEILKEAIRGNPDRLAIRTKLLEVYAKRRDIKGFEQLATQLFSVTQGQGDDWARAQELGVQIDPENPLYRPGGLPTSGQSSVAMDAVAPVMAVTPPTPLPSPATSAPPPVLEAADSGSVDLDLDLASEALNNVYAASAAVLPPAAAPEASDADVDFNFDVDLPYVDAASTPPATATTSVPDFDIGEISLDLDGGNTAPGALAETPPVDLDLDDDGRDPLVRKFELAEEFRQIGDVEGARDLLQEVVARADGALKTKAQALLKALN